MELLILLGSLFIFSSVHHCPRLHHHYYIIPLQRKGRDYSGDDVTVFMLSNLHHFNKL